MKRKVVTAVEKLGDRRETGGMRYRVSRGRKEERVRGEVRRVSQMRSGDAT